MAKPRNKFVDLLQYIGLRTVAMAFYCFPVEVNTRSARLLGRTWFKYVKRHRNRAMTNISRSFPGMSINQQETIARASMEHLCMLVVELLFTPRLIRVDTWRKYCRLENFQEALQLMIKRNQSLIMLTGHYGNWEVLGYALATLGFETTSVFRPLDNPYVNRWVLEVREKQGQRMLAKKGMTEEVQGLLGQGGAVGFIADQNAGPKGIFVDFFGRKASTYKSIGLLAMEYNIPVIVGYARRAPNGRFFYTIGVQEIIYPHEWAEQNDPLRYITQRYTKAIEDMVRAEPTQYLWAHRRWKTRPKGEAPEPYD